MLTFFFKKTIFRQTILLQIYLNALYTQYVLYVTDAAYMHILITFLNQISIVIQRKKNDEFQFNCG